MNLRPYQQESLDLILKHYSSGEKKVLLHLDTGAGKTKIFSEVLKRAHNKGSHALMVVRGRALVEQAHQRLLREKVPHGVIMNGHVANFPSAKIQVCSIDTLRSRGLTPKADLIVYDEAHMATSKSYHDFVSNYPNAFHLPVTATPYMDKPLKHIANVVVRPIDMKGLISQGFLVPARYFAPTSVDLSNCRTHKTKDGIDYVTSDIEAVVNNGAIIGSLIESYKKFSELRPTLIFAVSIAHSMQIIDMFNNVGIKAEHLDKDSSGNLRSKTIERLESGETKIVSNVGILGTGVDIPCLGCVMFARPTKSLNLYLQISGRGTRPYPGKKDFIILDTVGNINEHGFITDMHEVDLDGRKKKKDSEVSLKRCENCFAMVERFNQVCPECSASFAREETDRPREALYEDGTLVEVLESPIEERALALFNKLAAQQYVEYTGKYRNPGWVWHKLEKKFGKLIANKVYWKNKHKLVGA